MPPARLEILSILVGVAAIVLAVVLYRKSRRIKKLAYMLWSFGLLRDFKGRIGGLSISYRDRKIPNFTITKVALWNSGRETIDSTDIATADPLRIVAKDGSEILDATLTDARNPANQLAVSSKPNQILVTFDFLDPRDGGIVQVLHSGRSSREIAVVGTVKGAGHPTGTTIGASDRSYRKHLWFSILFFVTLLLMACGLAWAAVDEFRQGHTMRSAVLGLFAMLVLVGAVLPTYPDFAMWKSRPPEGFDVFFDDPKDT